MPLYLEERPSDSPFVDRVWRSRSEDISTFTSIAVSNWEMVFWKQEGVTQISVRGPETKASVSPVPENTEFFGILFKPGTFMPHMPVSKLVDNDGIMLPGASSQSFWLNSSVWRLPNFENADTFVNQLVRDDLLARETVVDDVLRGYSPYLSLRTIERRFLRATGISYRTMQQIERARQATLLLKQGTPIVETAYQLGYFDHAHLTKSLRHYIGQTPTQIMDKNRAEQLSLLYKTDSFDSIMMTA